MASSAAAVSRVLILVGVAIAALLQWVFTKNDAHLGSGNVESKFYVSGKHQLCGLILARGGSKGIPRKNLALLHGQPMIYWTLHSMINASVFESIWVSTDDDEISKWVQTNFPQVKVHKRASYAATDDASSLTAVQEFLTKNPKMDAIGLVQTTSPFLKSEYLKKASEKLQNYESVFSVKRSKELRWREIDKGIVQPLNFQPQQRPTRQSWKGELVETGMFYFFMTNVAVTQKTLQGSRASFVEVPPEMSLEIDTPLDLRIAEALIKNDVFQMY